MSASQSPLPARPSLEQLRKQAKELLRELRSGDADAVSRVRAHVARPAKSPADSVALADVQFVLAREYGFESWARLKRHIESIARLTTPSSVPFLPE